MPKWSLSIQFFFAVLFFTAPFITLGPERALGQKLKPRGASGSTDNAVYERERDGLLGPVRRVRIETASIVPKSGKLVEGPHRLLGTVIYDQNGKKIDDEYFSVSEVTQAGSQTYKYGDKGNVVETTVRGTNGSVISQETYAYEYDPIGNWIKMVTSAAVLDSGKLAYEQTEVTYRTIVYYRTDAVAKLLQPTVEAATPSTSTRSSKPPLARAALHPILSNTKVSGKLVANSTSSPQTSSLTPAESGTASEGTQPVGSAALKEGGGDGAAAARLVSPSALVGISPSAAAAVRRMSTEELNSAAIDLPRPVYPTGAGFAHIEGKVDVRVAVNEKGEVTAAQMISGHPLLRDAAEQSALKSRFSPAKLSSQPGGAAGAVGVLSYLFKYEPAPESNVSVEPKSEVRFPAEHAASPAPAGNTATNSSSSARKDVADLADQGLKFYEARKFKEAVEVYKHAIDLTPNSALLYSNLGTAYFALGKLKEANASFKQALSLDTNLTDANYGLGMVYYSQGRFAGAIKAFERALTVKPDLAAAHYGIALAFYGLKRNPEAQKHYEILRKLDKNLANQLFRAIDPSARLDLIHGNLIPGLNGNDRQRP